MSIYPNSATNAVNVDIDDRLTDPATHHLQQGDGTTLNQPVFATSTSGSFNIGPIPAPVYAGNAAQYMVALYAYLHGADPLNTQDQIQVQVGDFYRQNPNGNHLTLVSDVGNIVTAKVTVQDGYQEPPNSPSENLHRGADNPMFGIGIVNAAGGASSHSLVDFLKAKGTITYEDQEKGPGGFDELLHAVIDTHSPTGVSMANASGAIVINDFTGNAVEMMNSTNRLFPPGNHGDVGAGLETVSLTATHSDSHGHQVPIAGVVLNINHDDLLAA